MKSTNVQIPPKDYQWFGLHQFWMLKQRQEIALLKSAAYFYIQWILENWTYLARFQWVMKFGWWFLPRVWPKELRLWLKTYSSTREIGNHDRHIFVISLLLTSDEGLKHNRTNFILITLSRTRIEIDRSFGRSNVDQHLFNASIDVNEARSELFVFGYNAMQETNGPSRSLMQMRSDEIV